MKTLIVIINMVKIGLIVTIYNIISEQNTPS